MIQRDMHLPDQKYKSYSAIFIKGNNKGGYWMIDVNSEDEIKQFYESEMKNDPIFRRVMERLAKL
jgi:ribosomal protein S6